MNSSTFKILAKLYGQQIMDNNSCPRCNGRLVIRHSFRGDFVGCSNFSTTGCKFTKKHWMFLTSEELMYYKNKEDKNNE